MQMIRPESPEADYALAREALTETPSGEFAEFYVGKTIKANKAEMDRRAAHLAASIPNIRFGQRVKIGMNRTCPCGSGLKFKKCCIDKALPS